MARRLLGAVVAIATLSVAITGTHATASTRQSTVVSANPADNTPNAENDTAVQHSTITAVARLGTKMYAGGKIHTVTNATKTRTYTRHNLMSFDMSTGAMTAFAPSVNGQVWALHPSGTSLYVGGYFTTVNGIARRGIAKIDATTGAVDKAFNARLDGSVTEIRLVDGRLLVGGGFSQRLLALNPATGADTGYIHIPITGKVAANAGRPRVYRFAVDRARTRLVAIGNFTTVGGNARSRAFMLNLRTTSATVASWYYQPLKKMCRGKGLPSYLRDVDFAPNGNWFVIDSTGYVPATTAGIGTDLCDAAARFETAVASPAKPTWINYTGGDTLHSVAVTGSVVYVQGHQRWLNNPYGRDFKGQGAVDRPGIGALDPNTGRALSWNPGKTRGVGGKDFLVTRAGLWVASDGARFAGEYHKDIAFLPL